MAERSLYSIRRARKEGFWTSQTLERESPFDGIRGGVEFQREIAEAKRLEAGARAELERVSGRESKQSN